MDNIIRVTFKKSQEATTRALYQYDYGQILKFIDIELPTNYEVHFSNRLFGDATIQIGDSNGVLIPDQYLQTGLTVYAWIYLHTTNNDGETLYQVTIPVLKRAQPSEETPTPEQQSIIEQTLATLETNVRASVTAASNCTQAVIDSERARDISRAYMEYTEGYKNTAANILTQIQHSTDLGYITIGSTRLTEANLIQLLQLIEE